MVIGKCTDIFRGFFGLGGKGEVEEGVGATWDDISMEEFVMGEENLMKGVQKFLALFKKQ